MDDFNDFYDDFDGDDFMDDGSDFDENFEPDELPDDSSEIEDDLAGDDICDDEFTTEDAIFFGGAMGYAYEEGLDESKRRRIEREMNKDKDQDDL